jgi:hypothetical protein
LDKPRKEPHNVVSEEGQETDPLKSNNHHQKEVVEGEALPLFDQESLKKRNKLRYKSLCNNIKPQRETSRL